MISFLHPSSLPLTPSLGESRVLHHFTFTPHASVHAAQCELPCVSHLQVLSGACVTQGELEAVVTAVGPNTFFGKTIALLGAPEERGHLQKANFGSLSGP